MTFTSVQEHPKFNCLIRYVINSVSQNSKVEIHLVLLLVVAVLVVVVVVAEYY